MKELYSNDSNKVAEFLKEFYADEQKFKQTWANQARTWISFVNGDQNPYPYAAPIMVNNNPSNYTQSNDARQNMYQGDELESIMRTLVSYMTRQRPTVNVKPVDEDQDSKNIARIGSRVLDAKYQIDNELNNSKLAATCVLTLGTVYGKDYWDYSAGNYVQKTDEMGQPVLDEQGQPVLMKTGNNQAAILTPFTVSVDNNVIDFDRQPLILESYMVDVDWAKEAYDMKAPGFTGQVENIMDEGLDSGTVKIAEQLKYAIPFVSWGTQYNPKGKCLVQECHIRPNKTHPRGRLLITAGGVVVYDSKEEGSPYFMENEAMIWHPYTCMKYEEYFGRFLGKGLIEGLYPLQMRLNEINGAILENANTMAKPNIMAAIGQLKKGITNGRGANIYTYATIPGATPPFVLQGTPLPSQFFTERAQIIEQMVRKAGTNFVMSGQPPTGVTAASAIEQLLENASTQNSSIMMSWQDFHEKRFSKKLRIIHKFMNYPDPNLQKYLKTLAKDALDTEIQDFVGATDLADGVVVEVEPGSMIPKSKSAQTETYMTLAKEGGLGPAIAEDSPRGEKMRAQIMEKIGLEPLETEEGIDLKKAKWENDRMMKGEPVEVSPYDKAQIHLPCHIGKIQDPNFLENASDEQKIALDNHIKEHEMIEAQKAQEAQMQQMQAQDTQHQKQMELKGAGKPASVPTGEVPMGDDGGIPLQ